MRGILGLLAIAAPLVGAAQDLPEGATRPIKFVIRHADPWAIKMMLEGQPIISPEVSTVMALMGAPAGAAQAANAWFANGTWHVNPGDNSLWFLPNRPGTL